MRIRRRALHVQHDEGNTAADQRTATSIDQLERVNSRHHERQQDAGEGGDQQDRARRRLGPGLLDPLREARRPSDRAADRPIDGIGSGPCVLALEPMSPPGPLLRPGAWSASCSRALSCLARQHVGSFEAPWASASVSPTPTTNAKITTISTITAPP
jgi:hypothetical protein